MPSPPVSAAFAVGLLKPGAPPPAGSTVRLAVRVVPDTPVIVTTLIAATVAAAEPTPAPPPAVAPAPAAEKKMACCEKMAKGEGCACCKDMADAGKSAHEGHGDHKQ